MFPIISISGSARSGKDTLFQCLSDILAKHNINVERFGLADELKADLDGFLRQRLGISAFTTDPAEKDLIRPLMVAYGKIKRIQTKGQYWVGLIEPKVKESLKDAIFHVLLILDIANMTLMNCNGRSLMEGY
jgi:hypothetical protein